MTVRIIKQTSTAVEIKDYLTELDAVEAYNNDSGLGDSQLIAIEELIQVLNYDCPEDVEYRFEYV